MTLYDELEVHVELDGATLLAGSAQFHRSRGNLTSTTFQYERAYLKHARAYQLDPTLSLVSGTQQTPIRTRPPVN
jgi:serine/threonine-protein kinase HipA